MCQAVHATRKTKIPDVMESLACIFMHPVMSFNSA